MWLETIDSKFPDFADNEEVKELFHDLSEWLFPPALFFIQNYCTIPAPVDQGMVFSSLLRLLGCLLSSPEGFASDTVKVAECLFVKALYWSVGAAIDGKSRGKFDVYMRDLMSGKVRSRVQQREMSS